MKPQEPRIIDAYRFARRINEGCQHMLGCCCDPPFWLRPPTPAEDARAYKPRYVESEEGESCA